MTPPPVVVVKPVEPSCRPGVGVDLPRVPSGVRACVIDVGSRNVKLLVAESPGADPRGLHPVRTCRARLQLGEKTQNPNTHEPQPLKEEHRIELAGLIALYQKLCVADGGQLAGAFATEWARKVPNFAEIDKQVTSASGVTLNAISQEREGALGYLAATKGQRGRVVLDFGSRSFQVSVWPVGAAAPSIVGLPLGIDEVGERFFDAESVPNFAAGEQAFVTALKAELPPDWKKQLKRAAGRLSRTLVSLGENGDVALAIDGKLWSKGKPPRVADEPAYLEQVAAASARVQPLFGRIMGAYDLNAIRAWRKRLQKDQALFAALRAPERRKAFGHKMLAFPALVNFIATELGVERVVLVPDELAMGLLVEAQSSKAVATVVSASDRP
ncbi:MAG: hypothetical protein SF187_17205 [Deltaproteobacteria bacterium]|nr:hypothetical protein [Deltaproteobacteria bacterium]